MVSAQLRKPSEKVQISKMKIPPTNRLVGGIRCLSEWVVAHPDYFRRLPLHPARQEGPSHCSDGARQPNEGSLHVVDDHAGAKFRLEPGGLGGHDVAGVGNAHHLFHRDGIECQGSLHLAAVDTSPQFVEPTQTADEIDALGGAEIGDAELFVENQPRRDVDIEHTDGIFGVEGAGTGVERIPTAAKIERKLVGVFGTEVFGAAIAHFEIFLEPAEQFVGSQSVEVAHHAVVVENRELLGGEAHGQVVVVFLAAGVFGVGLGASGAHARRRSGTMVAVGNVEGIHGAKLAGDGLEVGRRVDQPEGVTETVDVGHEIIEWFLLGDSLDEGLECVIVPIGQKGGTDVGVGGGEVPHAVVFFVAAGEFVLLDATGIVVVDVRRKDDAILRVPVHGLGIEVVALALVLHEPTFGDEAFELATSFGIDARIVLIGALGKIDFGANDVVERTDVVARLGTGFGGIEDVVGTRGDEMGDAGGRT